MQMQKMLNSIVHKYTIVGGDRRGRRGELPKAGSGFFLVSRPEGERRFLVSCPEGKRRFPVSRPEGERSCEQKRGKRNGGRELMWKNQ